MAEVYRVAAIEAARIAGASPEMDTAANRVLLAAQGLAAKHVRTGAYSASFAVIPVKGKRGVLDRMVINTDPAAVSIEFGHLTPPGATAVRRPVPGLHIMRRAAGSV